MYSGVGWRVSGQRLQGFQSYRETQLLEVCLLKDSMQQVDSTIINCEMVGYLALLHGSSSPGPTA